MDNYKIKYIKYKNKYLELQKTHQVGKHQVGKHQVEKHQVEKHQVGGGREQLLDSLRFLCSKYFERINIQSLTDSQISVLEKIMIMDISININNINDVVNFIRNPSNMRLLPTLLERVDSITFNTLKNIFTLPELLNRVLTINMVPYENYNDLISRINEITNYELLFEIFYPFDSLGDLLVINNVLKNLPSNIWELLKICKSKNMSNYELYSLTSLLSGPYLNTKINLLIIIFKTDKPINVSSLLMNLNLLLVNVHVLDKLLFELFILNEVDTIKYGEQLLSFISMLVNENGASVYEKLKNIILNLPQRHTDIPKLKAYFNMVYILLGLTSDTDINTNIYNISHTILERGYHHPFFNNIFNNKMDIKAACLSFNDTNLNTYCQQTKPVPVLTDEEKIVNYDLEQQEKSPIEGCPSAQFTQAELKEKCKERGFATRIMNNLDIQRNPNCQTDATRKHQTCMGSLRPTRQ